MRGRRDGIAYFNVYTIVALLCVTVCVRAARACRVRVRTVTGMIPYYILFTTIQDMHHIASDKLKQFDMYEYTYTTFTT